jgi:tripartite-type tricarboxylate transporter receptor subunit TctC
VRKARDTDEGRAADRDGSNRGSGQRPQWAGALALALAFFPMSGAGQTFPAKPIRMIVPYPPGGATDLLGRLVGQKLGERVGQTVIVENRTGGGGNIGAEFVARAPADGYTVMIGGVPHAINMSLYSKPGYDLANDLTGITQLATYPSMIAVHPSLPVKSVKELIALAKAKPGALNFGASPGSPNHLAIELVNVMAKVTIVHIGYKGTGPMLIDLISGQIHLASVGFPGATPHVKAGRLRAIAVTGAKRATLFPELPTVAESGLAGFDVTSWYGVLGPARIPPDIVSKLNAEIRAGIESEDIKARLATVGAEVETTSSQDFARIIRSEIERWAQVVKASGARAN